MAVGAAQPAVQRGAARVPAGRAQPGCRLPGALRQVGQKAEEGGPGLRVRRVLAQLFTHRALAPALPAAPRPVG
ncbi:hypothetical protein JYU34_011713 [Plutella xylostella]|uniref:Uncharacterized protein n=1 Tax=Plutella xylostella TaxID=51655 RepID=A0ABQ7QDC8_PLUXY|nr:hypothetical protein JYU34_011713 [Plutella xylostella]